MCSVCANLYTLFIRMMMCPFFFYYNIVVGLYEHSFVQLTVTIDIILCRIRSRLRPLALKIPIYFISDCSYIFEKHCDTKHVPSSSEPWSLAFWVVFS